MVEPTLVNFSGGGKSTVVRAKPEQISGVVVRPDQPCLPRLPLVGMEIMRAPYRWTLFRGRHEDGVPSFLN